MRTIGEAMRAARDDAGKTAREVGLLLIEKGGLEIVRENQISDWERGKVNPGPEVRAAYVAVGLLTAKQGHLPHRAAA